MDLPHSQLEKAKKAIEFLSGIPLDHGESSSSFASDRITSPSTSLHAYAASSVTNTKILTVIKCLGYLPYNETIITL